MAERPREIRIGCGLITWGTAPESQALTDIQQAGYAGAVPKLAPERSAPETVRRYAEFGLVPAPPYFGAPLWDLSRRDQILAGAGEAARFAREVGCTELYIAAHGEYAGPSGRGRRDAAGHVDAADGMTEEAWTAFIGTLEAVGAATLREGVRACFHNHVGTVIETEAEYERLCAETDPERVFLGPDTGHLAWGGVDAAGFVRRHVDRILTAHLKDIEFAVRDEGRAAGWSYGDYTERGVFQELGRGDVDLTGVLEALRSADFAGWLVVETDVTQLATPGESAEVSRRYLRDLGL